MVFVRMARSESARALPWISARDSEKFANRTVNHSQMAIWRLKPLTGLRNASSDEHDGDEDGADPDHEHDRVPDLHPGIQLPESHSRGAGQDGKA